MWHLRSCPSQLLTVQKPAITYQSSETLIFFSSCLSCFWSCLLFLHSLFFSAINTSTRSVRKVFDLIYLKIIIKKKKRLGTFLTHLVFFLLLFTFFSTFSLLFNIFFIKDTPIYFLYSSSALCHIFSHSVGCILFFASYN